MGVSGSGSGCTAFDGRPQPLAFGASTFFSGSVTERNDLYLAPVEVAVRQGPAHRRAVIARGPSNLARQKEALDATHRHTTLGEIVDRLCVNPQSFTHIWEHDQGESENIEPSCDIAHR